MLRRAPAAACALSACCAAPLLELGLAHTSQRATGMHVAASAGIGGPPARTGAAHPAAAIRPVAPPPPTAGSAVQPPRGQQARGVATSSAAAAAEAAPCPVSAAAFASALDAGSALPVTWLSHWQQQEARRQARRTLIDSTRGRQQQRLRQVATLLGGGEGLASSSRSGGGAAAAAGAVADPHPSSRAAGAGPLLSDSISLDLPSMQQMSELDELTWLASLPPEGDAAAAAAAAASDGMRLWAREHDQQQQRPQQQGRWHHAPHPQHPEQHPGEPHARIVGLAGDAASGSGGAAALAGPVQLRVGLDVLSVRPLWIAVYQPEEGGPAKLFESVAPLLPDVVGRLSADIAPFCSVTGLRFGGADVAEAGGGPWRNFFVGLMGSVAAEEDDILWPNQVLHRDRVLFNVRNGWDVAKFLADPEQADVEAHRANLLRLAAERGYRRGWAWHMLRLRWGEAALRRFGLEV